MQKSNLISSWKRWAFVAHLALYCGICCAQTEKPYRNSAAISFTGLAYVDSGRYLGPTIEYTYLPTSWLGLQSQFTWFPTKQSTADAEGGGHSSEMFGSVLLGHRYKRVRYYGKAGMGDFRIVVFKGGNQYQLFYATRDNLSYQAGAGADIQITHRWSARYQGDWMRVQEGPFTQIVYTTTVYDQPTHRNSFQFSNGLVFHF